MADASETEQMTGNVLRLGAVASVNLVAATCTVEIGDMVTGDLPWISPRAGGLRIWSPPTVGEQCLVLSPEGDIDAGVVLTGLYSTAFPAPSDNADLHLAAYPDGALIGYDSASHALTAILPAGGTAALTCPGGLTITGDVTVNGTVTASEDVLGGGISLKNHTHGGVQAGGAQTGAPA